MQKCAVSIRVVGGICGKCTATAFQRIRTWLASVQVLPLNKNLRTKWQRNTKSLKTMFVVCCLLFADCCLLKLLDVVNRLMASFHHLVSKRNRCGGTEKATAKMWQRWKDSETIPNRIINSFHLPRVKEFGVKMSAICWFVRTHVKETSESKLLTLFKSQSKLT